MARDLGIEAVDNKPFVFISYNSEDNIRISRIAKHLAAANINIWYDKGIRRVSESEWQEQIAIHIRNAEIIIFFISKGIFQKENSFVKTEYDVAVGHNKKICLVVLDSIDYSTIPAKYDIWWSKIGNKQYIEAMKMTDKSTAEQIINEIFSECDAFKNRNEIPQNTTPPIFNAPPTVNTTPPIFNAPPTVNTPPVFNAPPAVNTPPVFNAPPAVNTPPKISSDFTNNNELSKNIEPLTETFDVTSVKVQSYYCNNRDIKIAGPEFYVHDLNHLIIKFTFAEEKYDRIANIEFYIIKEGRIFVDNTAVRIKVEPGLDAALAIWGTDKKDYWEPAYYTAVARINNSQWYKCDFQVIDIDRTPLDVYSVTLRNSDKDLNPLDNIAETKIFYQNELQFVKFSYGIRIYETLFATMFYKIIGPDGKVFANSGINIKLKPEFAYCMTAYGYEEKGKWDKGTYQYFVTMGKNVISGTFDVV